tara:strand:- start:302 stop:541 length:240 start_codon:yes stop_codon:yes gene_type:complete
MKKKENDEIFVLCVKENIEQINYYAVSESSRDKAIEFFKIYNKDKHPKAIKKIVVNESETIEKVYNQAEFKKLLKKYER